MMKLHRKSTYMIKLYSVYVTVLFSMCVCGVLLFVCVEVLRPSQPNRVMSSVVSLPNHTFTGQA